MLKFCLRIVLFSALLFLAKDALATAYNIVLRGVCHLMAPPSTTAHCAPFPS